MLDVVLHTGIEHPSLLFVVVSSIITFVVGLLLGARTGVVQRLVTTEQTESTN